MIFGECGGKVWKAARLHAQRFSDRVLPTYKVILRIINNACQGNFSYKRVHRQRDGDIIKTVKSNLHISIREIARRTGFSIGSIGKFTRP